MGILSRHFTPPPVSVITTVTAFALALTGCSTAGVGPEPDREVYGIIERREVEVLGKSTDFQMGDSRSRNLDAGEILRERSEGGRLRIDLEEAVELSIRHRREYQTARENLFLAGLELTRARHDFQPRFGAGLASDSAATQLAGGTTLRTGATTQASFDRMLMSGGKLAVDVAQDIFRFYLTGSGPAPATRLFNASLSQPLLRGSGIVAVENLTQRERDVVYAIRDFSRYQKSNVIDVVTAYCQILQEKDRVRNEFSNYQNLAAFTARAAELAKDRLPRFQVDLARQDELRARNRYILAVNAYRSRIDDFKLLLGLPAGVELLLDDDVLRSFEQAGLAGVPIAPDDALELAVAHRLDLLNEIDRFEDAKRKIEVAADGLRPGLDLFVAAQAETNGRDGRRSYARFDPDVYRAGLGVDLDLPLDRLEARNDLRRAEIAFERQIRRLSLALDEIDTEIRAGIRGLEVARERYEIQKSALALATRRVESVPLLLEASRATTRDLLEARNDQLAARNALTSALIDYHLTRLNLLHDLGVFDPSVPEFWVASPAIPQLAGKDSVEAAVNETDPEPSTLISPEALFREEPALP